MWVYASFFFFFQAEDGIRDSSVTGVQTCALPICLCLAAARTNSLVGTGLDHLAALNGGYHIAFLVAALFAACASALGAMLLRFTASTTSSHDESRNEQRVPEVPA